jgi:hypothetical protein
MCRVGGADKMVVVEVRSLSQILEHHVRNVLDYESRDHTSKVRQFMSQNACVSMPA